VEPEVTEVQPDAPTAWKVQQLFHVTVACREFERSLAFYTTVGFKVLRDNRDVIWGDIVARNFGMPKAQGRGALLGIGDGPLETRLDLIQWLEPELPPPPDIPVEHRVPQVICLRVDNVAAAYEDLVAKGIPFVSTPRSARSVGVINVCSCRDPDGHVLELIEYEPGLLGSRVAGLPTRGGSSDG
jgi:glyoxylase I family protein